MRQIAGLIALAALFAASVFFAHSSTTLRQVPPTALDRAFNVWLQSTNKIYNTPGEYHYRKNIFSKNSEKVDYMNQVYNHKSALNQFADLTEEEFIAKFTGLKYTGNQKRSSIKHVSTGLGQQASIDWRAKGAVNPVKNQGQCGSCWAFSATSSIESAVFLRSGKLLNLAEQQLVDCSGAFGNLGCNGGWMDWSFNYLLSSGGQQQTADYPYTARDGTCKFNKALVKASISSYTDIPASDCNALASGITKQPVSVTIAANAIMFYTGGIFDNASCGTSLNHAVTAVGYGSENGKNFFLVRNSWGTGWGEQGYIRFSRDNQTPDGICGICMVTSYPNAM